MDKKRACLYIRLHPVSESDLGWKEQENNLRRYCRENGYEIADIYRVSASGTVYPPQLDEILKKAEHGEFDTFLCTSASRLGRNTSNVLHFCTGLQKAGCSFRFTKEHFSEEEFMRFIEAFSDSPDETGEPAEKEENEETEDFGQTM